MLNLRKHRPEISDDSENKWGIRDVLRIFNATEANHAPIAINDTTMLRFHIAILKDKK